jgi:hypothetical protein
MGCIFLPVWRVASKKKRNYWQTAGDRPLKLCLIASMYGCVYAQLR